MGRSRGGFGTKIYPVRDGRGVPLAVVLTPRQRHESRLLEAIVGKVQLRLRRGRPRTRPVELVGDKGSIHGCIRRWPARHGIEAVIPRRKDQHPGDGRVRFDRGAYRGRSVVERCIGRPKERRAVATRFDKLAVSYPSSVHWATI